MLLEEIGKKGLIGRSLIRNICYCTTTCGTSTALLENIATLSKLHPTKTVKAFYRVIVDEKTATLVMEKDID